MKRLLSFVVIVLTIIAASTTAFAGSHHGSVRSTVAATRYSICTLQDCAAAGLHTHSGTNYYAHYYGDGHDYHDYCGLANCTATGYHEHDGAYCFGHTTNDGHNYHRAGRGCH